MDLLFVFDPWARLDMHKAPKSHPESAGWKQTRTETLLSFDWESLLQNGCIYETLVILQESFLNLVCVWKVSSQNDFLTEFVRMIF